MKKSFFLLTLFILTVILFPAGIVSADLPHFVDGADLLSADEAARLEQRLGEISEAYACDVVIVTSQTYDSYSVQAAADDYYDENGYGYGAEYTGILLLISMTEREWAISTCGEAIGIFTDGALMRLEDGMMPYLGSGDYAGAFLNFAENCYDMLAADAMGYSDSYNHGYDYEYGYEYGYDYVEEGFDYTFWIPGAIVIGFIISLIVVNIMKGEMNTVRMQTGAASYEKKGSFRLTTQQDLFLYRNVRKTPRQTESSGRSGGSTVHRSSSGRSHGGRSGRF